MKFPTLYKRAKTGAVLRWSIETEGDKYWATHGQVGGKMQVDTPSIAEIKNTGQSNEKTPEEQAILEAERKWKRKVEHGGYIETLESIDNEEATDCGYFLPTLAETYKKGKDLPETVFASPKLDGLRAVISKDGAFSRRGKKYVTSKFIEKALEPIFEQYPDLILDGELYNHDLKDDFDKIASLARKTKEKGISQEDWKAIRDILQFHIFDCKLENRPEMTFTDRCAFLVTLIYPLSGDGFDESKLKLVNQVPVDNDFAVISNIHDNYVKQGYEGAMVRNPDAPYIHERTKDLQKVKIFITDEFEIDEIVAGKKGKMMDKAGRVYVRLKDGTTSKAGINFPHDKCKDLLENKVKYVGRIATVKFQGYTPKGKLRFAKMIDIDRPDL